MTSDFSLAWGRGHHILRFATSLRTRRVDADPKCLTKGPLRNERMGPLPRKNLDLGRENGRSKNGISHFTPPKPQAQGRKTARLLIIKSGHLD